MPYSARLAERDVDGVLSVLGIAASTDDVQPFGPAVLQRLVDLIPAEVAGYWEYEKGRGTTDQFSVKHCEQEDDGASEHWANVASSNLMEWWPLHDDRLAPLETATFLSDFVSERAKSRHRWYAEVMRPIGQEHECKVLLPAPDGVTRGFYLVRKAGNRDFTERDRALLNVLRPHLEAVRRRWEQRRVGVGGLTTRERELVVLLRDGLTNQEIAERLVISTSTVRSHLESIFEKLGVHTRTAAVARAFSRW